MSRYPIRLFVFAFSMALAACGVGSKQSKLGRDEAHLDAAQVVADWASLSEGLGGKVVFWQQNELQVLDIGTGQQSRLTACEWDGDGEPPFPKWSPNGERVLFHQGGCQLMVVNADGSGLSEIGTCGGDGSGWWTDEWIVHTNTEQILRTQIDGDNQALSTEIVFDEPPVGQGYGTVEMVGDYVSFTDSEANIPTGGYHRGLIVNWVTGETREIIPRDSDSCGIRQKPDGSGTVIYHHENHWDPAVIQALVGQQLGEVAPLPGRRIAFIRWSNHLDYLVHNDADFFRPDRQQRAWLREISTGANVVLGEDVWYPDLWIPQSGEEPLLAAPTDLILTPISGSRVSLAWRDNSANEDGFRVYRDGEQLVVEVAADNPVFIDETVIEGQTYSYWITANLGQVESDPSNTASITALPPFVELLSPQGGESLMVGETYEVRWSTNMPAFDATIRLSLDGGESFETILPTWKPGSTAWRWKIAGVASSQCYLRIEDYQGTPVYDSNTEPFSILADEPEGLSGTSCNTSSSKSSQLLLFLLILWSLNLRKRDTII